MVVTGARQAAAASFFRELAANFELTLLDVLAICDGGDIVTVPIRYGGRVVGGGEIPEAIECHVWRFDSDGKIAAFNHVLDLALHEQAFAARG